MFNIFDKTIKTFIMNKEYKNIKMKSGYKLISPVPNKTQKFIFVYNWDILKEVHNAPSNKEPSTYHKKHYPLIGFWKLKTNKYGN